MQDAQDRLKVKPLTKRFSFDLLNFHYFKNKEWRDSFFGALYLCPQVTIIPYILVNEVILFRHERRVVELNRHIVGIFALHPKPDALYISSLAVAPEHRRLGIATYMLTYAGKLAERLGSPWLELSVSKTNVPALRLYIKFGFTKEKEKKWSFILRRRVRNKA